MKRWVCFVCVIALLLPASAWAKGEDVSEKIGAIVFYGGETLSLSLTPASKAGIRILSGQAEGLPHMTDAAGQRRLGLDLYSRSFSALIKGVPLLQLSGPRSAHISGIQVSNWGHIEKPAIVIDRDTSLKLSGSVENMVIAINPLARATLHLQALHIKGTLTVVNGDPAWTIIKGVPKNKLQFKKWEPTLIPVTSSEGWGNAPEGAEAATDKPKED